MKRTFLVVPLLLLALPLGNAARALEITSVRPAAAVPGERVTVTFTDAAAPPVLLLGEQAIPAEETGTGVAAFRIPLMQPGTYAVQFREAGSVVTTAFRLTVLEPVPVITSLRPGNVPECAEIIEKQIDVYGRNFFPESRLLVDGAIVPSSVLDPQHLVFDASVLAAGVYGIQVMNPAGNRSLPYSLYVNSVPKIESVNVGDDYTSHYELVIRGGNFYQQSTLLVTEEPPGLIGTRPRQQIVWGKGRQSHRINQAVQDDRDYLFYRDCHTLVYYRYPVSGQEKELTLKVINPDGKASESYRLMAN